MVKISLIEGIRKIVVSRATAHQKKSLADDKKTGDDLNNWNSKTFKTLWHQILELSKLKSFFVNVPGPEKKKFKNSQEPVDTAYKMCMTIHTFERQSQELGVTSINIYIENGTVVYFQ